MHSIATPTQDSSLEALDTALLALRRMWLQHPDRRRRFLDELGVSVEFACVRALFAIALGKEGQSVAELAEQLVIAPSTASRLVNQVVAAGYAKAQPSSDDRRRLILHLTPEGTALVARGTALRRQWLASATDDWSERDVNTLATLLHRLRGNLDKLES